MKKFFLWVESIVQHTYFNNVIDGIANALDFLADVIGDTPDTVILLAVSALGGIMAGAGLVSLNGVDGIDTFFRWAPLVMLAVSFIHYMKFTVPAHRIDCRTYPATAAMLIALPGLLIVAVNCWIFSLLGAEHPYWTGFFLISQIGGLPLTWHLSKRMLMWKELAAMGYTQS